MAVETHEIAPDLRVSRVTRGNWQLAARHGAPYDADAVVAAMARFVEAGIGNFDCADHYVGVEELIGAFRARHPALARKLTVQTKIVPDRDMLPTLKKSDLAFIVDRALQRLGVPALDLAQFHWWDYEQPGLVQAMLWLDELRRAGKIRHLATTNFDVKRLGEAVAAGVPIVSNQLQYSLIDRRPENGMVAFCRQRGIALQCYGVLAGGFLSERWLGQPAPADPLANRSLVKYRLIIEEFGAWALFQEMLSTLAGIGRKHGVGIAAVATRWILDRPGVATAIVGAGPADHLADLLTVFSFALDTSDRAAIDAVVAKGAGPNGDCYDLERLPGGRHATIMWTNQNTRGVGAR